MTKHHAAWMLLVVIWTGWAPIQGRAASAIRYSGSIRLTSHQGVEEASDGVSQAWECDVALKDPSWRIRIVTVAESKIIREVVAGFDGEKVATVITSQQGNPDPKIANHATLEFGGLPLETTLEVHPIWQIYCAPQWLAATGLRELPPVDGFGDGQTNLIRQVAFPIKTILDRTEGIHTSFIVQNPGYSWYTLDGRFYINKDPKPAQQPTLHSKLSLRSGAVPTGANRVFSFSRYAGKDDVEVYTLHVVETGKSKVEDAAFLPVPDKPMRVSDRRWSSQSPSVWEIEYAEPTPRRQWRSTENPTLARLYQSAIARIPTTERPNRMGARLSIIGFMCMIVGVGVGALLYHRQQGKVQGDSAGEGLR